MPDRLLRCPLHRRHTALILLASPFSRLGFNVLGHRVRRPAPLPRGEADVVAHNEATLNAMATVKALRSGKA
jgi:hypothetical protein